MDMHNLITKENLAKAMQNQTTNTITSTTKSLIRMLGHREEASRRPIRTEKGSPLQGSNKTIKKMLIQSLRN